MFQELTLTNKSLAKNSTTVRWIESDESMAAEQTHAVQRMFDNWGYQEKSSEVV